MAWEESLDPHLAGWQQPTVLGKLAGPSMWQAALRRGRTDREAMEGGMGAVMDMEALVEYLESQEDVQAAYLFGSQASGKARADSDVDVAVLLSEADSAARFDRRLQLMDVVSDVCGREADVIVLNDAPSILQHQVLSTGRLVYEQDREARVTFEVKAGKVYADLGPQREFFRRALFREVKEVGLGGR